MKCNRCRLVKYVFAGFIFAGCIKVFIILELSGSREGRFAGLSRWSFTSGMYRWCLSPGLSRWNREATNSPACAYSGYGNCSAGHTKHIRHAVTKHATLKSTVVCPGLEMAEPPQGGEFQVVKGDNTYVYSAYQDKANIRMIALRQITVTIKPLTCQLWGRFKDRDPLFITNATVQNLPENHERRFTSAFILCPLPSESIGMVPLAVSIVTGSPCSQATNILQVQGPEAMRSKFTVCVTPFNFRYSRAYELVEMIELNKLLGADRLVFYNYSTGPNVDKVLQMYSQENKVDVYPWPLPIKTDTWPPSGDPDIHYFAQIASLNDCLFRYRHSSQYIVYQDIDEFIIPTQHKTWGELIQERERLHGEVAAFQFKCVFFRKEWFSPSTDFLESAKKFKSIILAHALRESQYLPHGIRSKLIINPRLTNIVGVHQVWEASSKIDVVPENVANLHHYRNWENPKDPQPRVIDMLVVERYGSRLVQRLEKAWSKLEGVAMDINITVYGDHV